MKNARKALARVLFVAAIALSFGLQQANAMPANAATKAQKNQKQRITQEQRQAAADRQKAARLSVQRQKAIAPASRTLQGDTATVSQSTRLFAAAPVMAPMAMPMVMAPSAGGTPDYFGSPNWAFSPPIRKFVDKLPGFGYANRNDLGQYIPVGIPDINTYPGSDYYEIELVQYTERMHTDLHPTTLRGYVQRNTADANVSTPHYLGPMIIAQKDRPVRIKFTNKLPTGSAGDLFIPVDTTTMGAGMGPLGMDAMPMNYTQNRATLHLHGGRTPWISDGTPHQWITPADENTPYPKGVSVSNVPDMPDPGDGSQTFFYTNQQSARLMFYHDHAYGITRLNVYAGEAAGYMIEDDKEKELVDANIIPREQIALIIQDKSFVDANSIRMTDPTWNWGTGTPDANGIRPLVHNDLWYPHVYVPAQNPYDISGLNPYGRWHYGPWFWPPTSNITYPPVPNPYYDPNNAPWEPPFAPGVPHPSMPGESFFDTAMVNGTAFPKLDVQPKAYRFRILNAANDRFWNLQLYVADPCVTTSDGRINTEVKMVPAVATAGFPETWPTDGREGGVPDFTTAGPSFIQIGTEGGFLPEPAVVDNQPIAWNADPTTFNFGNVSDHALLIAPAERADVIIDFSEYAGKTLILYNDAPAAFPALDVRYDYYTDDPNLVDTGGHWGTQAGFGPNTRTIMQINVADVTPIPYDVNTLSDAFITRSVFASSQEPIIVGQSAYNAVYNMVFPTTWPNWGYSRIQDSSLSFKTVANTILTLPMQPKAIQDEMGEAFDMDYGRMSGKLGVELPNTNAGNQNFVLQNFIDPPTEDVNITPLVAAPELGDGIQIWKITHNGVDTHPIHFHLFDVQLINRVGWDGAIRLPDRNELGWKDTVRVSPLEDTIVAFRPVLPKVPFGVPDSNRPLDPTMPPESEMGFSNINPFTGQPLTEPVLNRYFNFGWEYVWHCHILSHEEMDMMRPIKVNVPRLLPVAPFLTLASGGANQVDLSWTDATPKADAATWGNAANEIGFRIERAIDMGEFVVQGTALANATTFSDPNANAGGTYRYRVIAYNAAGDSVSNIATMAQGMTAPGKPTAVVATRGNGQASVSFSAPLDGGSAITSYTVTSNPGGISVTDTATTIIVPGLTNGTAYSFTVAATNVIGTGPASNPSNSVIPATVPGAPTIGTATGGNAQASVSFTAPASNGGSAITSYTVTSSPGGRTATGTASPIIVTGLTNGASYTFTVTATNTVGTSAPSAASNLALIKAVPGAPTIGTATAGNAQATVRFTAPVSNGGSAITSYTVTSSPGGRIATGTASPITVTGLTNGTSYRFTVKATNAVGTSAPSNASNAVIPFIPTMPTAPSSLVARASILSANAPTVTLTWTDRSTSEIGFRIQRATNSTFTTGLATFAVGMNVTTYTDTAVVKKTRYYYRVQAFNPAFNSTYSNTATLITSGQVPKAPTSLAVISTTRTSLTMRWTDNANNETGFYVEGATLTGGFSRVATLPANATTYTRTGRQPNTSFRYRVRAYNADGVSAYSNIATGKTLP